MSSRTIIVTGGTRGLGACIAQHRAERGDRVSIVARGQAGLDAMRERLAGHDQVEYIAADISVSRDAKRIVETTEARFGRVDALVNNAGWFNESEFAKTSAEEIDLALADLRGTLLMTQTAIPYLKGTGAQIINIASGAGLRGERNHALYCATKAAMVVWSQAIQLELKEAGVRISTLCPDTINTWGAPEAEHHRYLRTDDVADLVDFVLAAHTNSLIRQVSLTALAGNQVH